MKLLSCSCLDMKNNAALLCPKQISVAGQGTRNSQLGYANRGMSDKQFCATTIIHDSDASSIATPSRRMNEADLATWHMRMDHVGKSVVKAICAAAK